MCTSLAIFSVLNLRQKRYRFGTISILVDNIKLNATRVLKCKELHVNMITRIHSLQLIQVTTDIHINTMRVNKTHWRQ